MEQPQPSSRHIDRALVVTVLLTAALYYAFLHLPAVGVSRDALPGACFLVGGPAALCAMLWHSAPDWLFVVWGLPWFLAWLPNPLLWIGLFCLVDGHPRLALLAGSLALLGGLSLAAFAASPANGSWGVTLSGGYYLWVASMICLTAGAAWQVARTTRRRRQEAEPS
jgi:hypothetical protein